MTAPAGGSGLGRFARSSGILLHPTSLPGGRLGPAARDFVDWLAAAGQSWWQMLPLGPPDRHGSPYKSASAFAAWPGLLEDPDSPVGPAEIAAFRARQADWLGDWEAYAGPAAVADQVRFQREWQALRAYARSRGVELIGDLPIYVAPGSADHRAHPELFQSGAVAGAPPDAFSATGQHWGNPLYDWPALRRRGYRWWVARLRRTFELFDMARIDHFRGFVAYWAIPVRAGEHAELGRWRRGPGRAPFDAVRRALGPRPLIAEDLGAITPAVRRLRDALGLPGMIVLQFGFDGSDAHNPHRPASHLPDRVAYTGTHDHPPIRAWWEQASAAQRARVDAELRRAGIAEDEPWWALNQLALRSPARVTILQAQDVLGLGAEARMNVPGREQGNWGWRLRPGELTADLAARLRAASASTGRGSAPGSASSPVRIRP